MKKQFMILAILSMVLVIFACSEEEDSCDSAALVEAGWTAFEAGNYEQAETEFTEAVNCDKNGEASVGLTWTYARLHEFQKAIDSREQARISLALTDPLLIDANVAIAYVYFERNNEGDLDLTELYALEVLAESPNYAFDHGNINHKNLHLLLAYSYWREDELELAQEQVDILEPNNGLSPDDSDTWEWESEYLGQINCQTYKEALLKKIEEIQRGLGE